MTSNKFIEDCTQLDSPIGDFANDVLRDKNFPSEKSEKEILEYLDFQTMKAGTNEAFKEFLSEFKKLKQ